MVSIAMASAFLFLFDCKHYKLEGVLKDFQFSFACSLKAK